MGLSHKLPIIQQLRREVEMRGFVLAVSGTREYVNGRWVQSLYKKTARVYRSERDKGKPERALVTVETFNRWTVPDVLGQLMEMQYSWATESEDAQ